MQSSKKEWLFESGKVVLSTEDIGVMEINLKGQRIDVEVKNKDFIKRVIRVSNEITRKPISSAESETETDNKKKKPASSLAQLKTIAETMSKNGITVTISYHGHTVVTLGSEAHPWLSQLITKTQAIAINNLVELIQMIF